MLLLVWCLCALPQQVQVHRRTCCYWSGVCVPYLNRYRFVGGHAVTGLPKHHIRDGDVALRLVVQLQDGHFPSVVGHIKVMVCYPVLNKLCMHRSPAPLQRSPDRSIMITSNNDNNNNNDDDDDDNNRIAFQLMMS